jgi:UDP-3-O-[3-hydroxymyristoyl] glucosamine N-acyltransferase
LFDPASALTELGINYSFYGTENVHAIKVKKITSINTATNQDLAFCSLDGEEAVATISKSNARAILCNKILEGQLFTSKKDQYIIFVDNPRLTTIRIMNKLYGMKNRIKHLGTAPTAQISDNTRIGKNCHIGDFVKIGENCIVGHDTVIDESYNRTEY